MKRLIAGVMAVFIVLAAASIVRAEEEKTPAPKPGPITGEDLDKLLAKMDGLQKDEVGFKADFTNEKESALVVDVVKSEGSLVFIKPNHFFRNVKGDEPVTVIAHNDELVIYWPKDKKAEKYFLKKEAQKEKPGGKEDVDSLLTGLSFERKKLEERFKVSAEREKSGLVRVDLLPKKDDDPMLKYLVRVSVWTDEKSPWPAIIETESPDGDISRDKFKNLESIKKEDVDKIMKDVFEFKPPAGTRILTPQK